MKKEKIITTNDEAAPYTKTAIKQGEGAALLVLPHEKEKSIDASEYSEYEVVFVETTAESYPADVIKKLKELANSENNAEKAVFVAKLNYLPKKEHLQKLSNAFSFAEMVTLTGRKDLSFVNKDGFLVMPYPALTGNELALKKASLLKNVKYTQNYTNEPFLQITMQVSGKKCYVFEQGVENTVSEKSGSGCKTC